jgi:hypothetical protein
MSAVESDRFAAPSTGAPRVLLPPEVHAMLIAYVERQRAASAARETSPLAALLGRRDRRSRYVPATKRYQRENGDPTALLERHLRGELLLGPHHGGTDTVRALSWDVDGKSDAHKGGGDARIAVAEIQAAARSHGLHPLLIASSKSGAGYHPYALLKDAVPTEAAHALAVAIARDASQPVDKSYPSTAGDGLVLALPLCGLNATQRPAFVAEGGSRFVHPVSLVPYDDEAQLEILADWPRSPASLVPPVVTTPRVATVVRPVARSRRSLPTYRSDIDVLAEQCEFVRHCADNVTALSYDEWLSLATVLNVFAGGAELFDAISASDPQRYEGARRTRRKFETIRGLPRHCVNTGYQCSKLAECSAIGVRSPAGLPSKLAKARASARRKESK